MKKIYLVAVFMVLFVAPSMAQIAVKMQEFNNTWVKPGFFIAAAIIFVVGALLNMGKFFGEHQDIKKGVTNILVYLGVLFLVGAIYTGIMTMTLS